MRSILWALFWHLWLPGSNTGVEAELWVRWQRRRATSNFLFDNLDNQAHLGQMLKCAKGFVSESDAMTGELQICSRKNSLSPKTFCSSGRPSQLLGQFSVWPRCGQPFTPSACSWRMPAKCKERSECNGGELVKSRERRQIKRQFSYLCVVPLRQWFTGWATTNQYRDHGSHRHRAN